MKDIVASSRSITDYELVKKVIQESKFDITEIICGGANGVDNLGRDYGLEFGIAIRYFIPDWNDITVEICRIGINKYGKKYNKLAGHNRNQEMCNYAKENNGGLILIWDGKSSGSKHMLSIAKKAELKILNMLYR